MVVGLTLDPVSSFMSTGYLMFLNPEAAKSLPESCAVAYQHFPGSWPISAPKSLSTFLFARLPALSIQKILGGGVIEF